MRITATAREATRRRILQVARERFAACGFDAVTTRDIAGAAAIATGTLFNYFATKEAIAAALAAEALAEARATFDARTRRGDSLEEELFGLVAAEPGARPGRTGITWAPVPREALDRSRPDGGTPERRCAASTWGSWAVSWRPTAGRGRSEPGSGASLLDSSTSGC